jgi:iron complex outermembrane receptor protein
MVPVTFTQKVNGDGGTTTGMEFSVQHDFGGFGVQANYAYASVSADDPMMDDKIPGVSEHTANLMGYYENDDFGARLMYNYRSDFYNGLHWNGNDLNTDAYGQIDATATWYVTDNFQLDIEALNLGNEQVVQYSEYEDRLMSVYENGRRFVISGRFSF